jgi:hypothetical protein
MSAKELDPLHEALAADYRAYAERTGRNAVRTLHAVTGIPQSTLYQFAEGLLELPKAQTLVAILRELGSDHTITALAQLCGGTFVRLPREMKAADSILGLISEYTEAARAASDALEDGRVTDAEIRGCEKELDEAITAAARLKLALQKMRDAEPENVRPLKRSAM